MDSQIEYIRKFMGQMATIHIQASPNYLLEFIITIILAAVYGYMCVAAKQISQHTSRIRPGPVNYFRKSGNYSRESIRTSLTRIQKKFCKCGKAKRSESKKTRSKRSNIEWLLEHHKGDFHKPISLDKFNRLLADKLISLTPSEYVRLDKERHLRDKRMKGYAHSLTTLVDNFVAKKLSELVLNDQSDSETMKSDNLCCRISDQVIKYFDSECVSENMVNTLNEIVEEISMDPSFPNREELTTLEYKTGNVQKKFSSIFDTKCDLVESSTSASTANTKTDVSDRLPI